MRALESAGSAEDRVEALRAAFVQHGPPAPPAPLSFLSRLVELHTFNPSTVEGLLARTLFADVHHLESLR